MAILERLIQKIYPGKWAELEEIDKRFNVVESRLGFPPKKRYQSLAGSHDMDTLLVDREWESMAAGEAAYAKLLADPEWQALGAEIGSIVKSNRREFYFVLE